MAKSVKPSWIVTHHGRNIHIVKDTASQLKNWERWILVLSDVHFDGECDRPVLKRLLQTAVKRDAMIISNGDWYDLCQGRSDARKTRHGCDLTLRRPHTSTSALMKLHRSCAMKCQVLRSVGYSLGLAIMRHHGLVTTRPVQFLTRCVHSKANANLHRSERVDTVDG